MKRQHVESAALESVGYDPDKKILELEFTDNGGVWQYYQLPTTVYKKFRNADSLGRYFVKEIKGRYEEKKVD